MAIMIWNEKYSVGVTELDEQHKSLIHMINEMHYAMNNDKGQEAITSIIEQMFAYMELHFSTEEGYMQQFGYLGLLAHQKSHEEFRSKARDLRERVSAGEFVLSFEILQFLSDWLQNHILVSDMKYTSLFAEKGLR
ncbi:bacteriohemerythrin [Geopsychrobacter electrodiphilus]|uniref:bacteriohemerythrin n=1 Tax=Geopsychrobacter electrodiphilus TaxID=225196 RepID=UPI00037C7420|nr:bacteriohemerythrin [Geopsychrobacter electrodiphilus]